MKKGFLYHELSSAADKLDSSLFSGDFQGNVDVGVEAFGQPHQQVCYQREVGFSKALHRHQSGVAQRPEHLDEI